jgi:hypothetical protein
MNDEQATTFATVSIMFIASILLAIGTNGFVGASLFFAIWAIAGVIQLKR